MIQCLFLPILSSISSNNVNCICMFNPKTFIQSYIIELERSSIALWFGLYHLWRTPLTSFSHSLRRAFLIYSWTSSISYQSFMKHWCPLRTWSLLHSTDLIARSHGSDHFVFTSLISFHFSFHFLHTELKWTQPFQFHFIQNIIQNIIFILSLRNRHFHLPCK